MQRIDFPGTLVLKADANPDHGFVVCGRMNGKFVHVDEILGRTIERYARGQRTFSVRENGVVIYASGTIISIEGVWVGDELLAEACCII